MRRARSRPRLWPVLGGLLPWADTGNGDQLWWKTGGSSDRWTVSTQEARSDDIVETQWTTSEVLLAFVEGRTELFGAFDDGLEPWFAPAREASVHLEWGDVHAAQKGDADDLVVVAAEILPVASPRGGWADGANFQRHWVTGDDEWSVTLERHGDLVGLRLTCSATQEDAARRAAAAVAERLGVTLGRARGVALHARPDLDRSEEPT